MQALLVALGNKYFLYAIIALMGVGAFQINSCNKKKSEEKLATYQRQLAGQLSEKEKELQEMKAELGVAESELMTQEELAKRLKRDKEELDADFDEFVKRHKLMIKSRDKTIASLKQKVKGGTTTVVVSNDAEGCQGIEDRCVISYDWEDQLGRFKLQDPDIFTKDNELFESSQVFKIYGEVYEQQDGSLQTRRLVLREVYQQEDGSYAPVPDGKANVIDSQFQYHNPPSIDTEWEWTDLFRMRGIAVGGVEIAPRGGKLALGLGLEFFTWEGLGIGTFTNLDFENPERMAQHISLQYNPTLWDTELNLGVYVSAGTPFAKFFQEYQFSTGLVFYLNN